MSKYSDDLSARAKRRSREGLFAGLVFGLVFPGLTFLYIWSDTRGVFQNLGYSHAEIETALIAVLAILLGAYVILVVIRYWPPKAEREPAFLRREMDNIHRRWRWLTLILSAVAVLNTVSFVHNPQDHSGLSGGFIAVMLFGLAAIVCFGPGCLGRTYRETLNDELMRTQRARAARAGYLLLMVGIAALYIVFVRWPQMAGPAAIAILCAGSVIPALYFVVLDWRSDATDKE